MSAAQRLSDPARCLSISAKTFRAWLKVGAPGDEIVYASGKVLDQQRDVAVLARQWAGEGLITLKSVRIREGEFAFAAEKLLLRDDGKGTLGPRLPDRDTPEGQCLAILRRAANFNLPCPTNREIMKAMRLNDVEQARYLVRKLADAGHIRVEDRGSRVTRVVTITETKRSTSRAMTPVARGAVQ